MDLNENEADTENILKLNLNKTNRSITIDVEHVDETILINDETEELNNCSRVPNLNVDCCVVVEPNFRIDLTEEVQTDEINVVTILPELNEQISETIVINEKEELNNSSNFTNLDVDSNEPPNVEIDLNEYMQIEETNDNILPEIKLCETTKIVELSRKSWKTDKNEQHYTKGVLWSPDGTCILTAVNLDGMHVIELPTDLLNSENIATNRPLNSLSSAVHIKEGGTVYDYAWYPYMNSLLPESCCWLASRQHEPIHMWDAYTGKLRCTYRGYDAADEVESAIAVTFGLDGQFVIGGYKKTIKIFQTNVPGREYTEIKTKHPISSFALHSAYPDSIVTGSWNSTIKLFDIRASNLGALSTLKGHVGGITYLKFSNDGTLLFSGARKDNKLCQWDLRDFSKPIKILQRNVKTNQRIYFDFNSAGQLASGDSEGLVRVWDIDNNSLEYQYFLHHDCCNGVSFHPNRPILGTSSGQYHFIEDKNYCNDDQQENIEIIYENSVILWWYGKNENVEID